MTANKGENARQGQQSPEIAQAAALLRQGKLKDAEILLQTALENEPKSFDALRLLGVACHFQKKNEEAARYFGKALDIQPGSAQTHYNLGLALSFLHEFDKAVASLERALELEPNNAEAHGALANALSALDRHVDAVPHFRRALETEPDDVLKHIKLGVSLQKLGRHEEALSAFQQAVRINLNDAGLHNMIGIVHNALNQFDAAADSFRRAIEAAPENAAAHCNLAAVLIALEDCEGAVVRCERAIELQPDHADAHYNLGTALNILKRHEEAAESCRRAVALKSDHAGAHNNLGIALNALKRHDEATVCYRRAIEFDPKLADAHNNLGNALSAIEDYNDAIDCYERALQLDPRLADAHYNLGNALSALRQYDAAAASYREVIALRAAGPELYNNLGITLTALKRHEEAVSVLQRATALAPDQAGAHFNLGIALVSLKRHEEAIESFRRAVEIDPNYPMALGYLANTSRIICDWSRFERQSIDLNSGVKQDEPVCYPFVLLSSSDSPGDQYRCAHRFAEYTKLERDRESIFAADLDRGGRIRVAYVSADFREHPVAYQIAELFELHDRDRFEIVGVMIGTQDKSAIGARVRKGFDRFIDVREESDRAAAEIIAGEKVHIAVDLTGYTEDSRPAIFAHRPAPIQANYLGYPSTMGVDFFDYIVVDPQIVPADQQQHFTERLVHLPDSYMVTDAKSVIGKRTPTRVDLGLPEDGFVFCCFHNTIKITPDVFTIWMRLLAEVSGSVIWLRIDNETALRKLRQMAVDCGIDPARLVVAKRTDMADHLARHRQADLFLDTFPYNAHASATDALWAGLPVLTRAGNTFAGRVGRSLLFAVGLPELVTQSAEEYEALALKLASEPGDLEKIRAKLANNRNSAALFDSERFSRNLEAAYLEMFETWRAGRKPQAFDVAAGQAQRSTRQA